MSNITNNTKIVNVFASSGNGVGLHVNKLCESEVPNVQRSSQ